MGTLELRQGADGPILRQFGGRTIEALFALLALQPGRARSREEVIDMLWPGVELDVGRNRLRNALAGLRRTLQAAGAGELLVIGGDTLALDRQRLASDVQRLQLGALTGAEDPSAGDFLPGHYADWVQDERLRLAALAEQAVQRRHERRARQASDAAEAETRLSAALRLPPRPLPMPISRFFGREAELQRLAGWLGQERLVTVCGHGGGGKTRLALEAARAAAAQRRAVAWVSLADSSDLRQLPEQVLAALQAPATQVVMHSSPGLGLVAPVLAALADEPLLLVLDNLEQFNPAELAHLLSELLHGAPTLQLLCTSRRPLELAGEQVLWLAPLPLDEHTPEASPAVQLFLDRARGVQPDLQLTGEPLATVARLCAALDGTPLAIELAAARLRSFSPQELLDAMAHGPTVLQRPRALGAALPRHESIDATLQWSVALLDAASAQTFRELGAFAGSFDAAAAAAVCSQPAVRDTLERLVAHSLLQRQGDTRGATRFAMLRLVADFARQSVPEAQRAALRQRHRHFYIQRASTTPRRDADALVDDDANLRQAITSAVADEHSADAVALGEALAPYFERHGIAPATLEQLCEAVERARADDPQAQALMVVLSELLINGAGRPELAAHWADRALERAHDARSRSLSLYMKARIAWARTLRPDDLRPWLEEALALARECGSQEAQARALWILGPVLRRQDRNPAGAEACYEEAAALFETSGDPIMANRMLYLRANCALELGQAERALALHRQCALACRRLRDHIGLMRQRNEEGVALLSLGRWHDAAGALADTVSLAWRHHHLYLLVFGLFNLPQAAVHLGQAADACRLMAFAQRRWAQHVGPMNPAIADEAAQLQQVATQALGAPAVQDLWAEGQALALPQAVALALGLAQRCSAPPPQATASPATAAGG